MANTDSVKIADKYELGDIKTNNLTLKKKALELWPALKNKFVGYNSYIGLEIEVEDFLAAPHKSPYPKYFEDFWRVENDGSLRPRNTSAELISVPLRGLNVTAALRLFQEVMKTCAPFASFSHRCGIHVHVNCRQFTVEQVNNIIYTYMCVESLLFDQFVKHNRSGNSFCPALTDCFVSGISKIKYSALNRVPLMGLGTLEFRHLQGTDNIEFIEKWILYLTRLVIYATSRPYPKLQAEILDLNSLSTYDKFVRDIFGPSEFVRLQDEMENDVYITKQVLGRDLT